MKILLAVDGSPYTRKMLDYVIAHSAIFDPAHEYTLLNAQPPLPPHARSAVGASVSHHYHEEAAHHVLEPATAALKAAGLTVTSDWKLGPAGETIARYAEDNKYDMVIMGTHGHGAFARLVMGSVTTQVLAHCGVPVLLVR